MLEESGLQSEMLTVSVLWDCSLTVEKLSPTVRNLVGKENNYLWRCRQLTSSKFFPIPNTLFWTHCVDTIIEISWFMSAVSLPGNYVTLWEIRHSNNLSFPVGFLPQVPNFGV